MHRWPGPWLEQLCFCYFFKKYIIFYLFPTPGLEDVLKDGGGATGEGHGLAKPEVTMTQSFSQQWF